MTKFDDLEKLADLKKKGILTEKEFEDQKKKLLTTTENEQETVSDENIDTSPLGRYIGCFEKYATFQGRASRSEYWWFFLFNFLIMIITDFIPFAGRLYCLFSVIPLLAVSVRRLHDINRGGWWVFPPLITIFLFPIVITFVMGYSLMTTEIIMPEISLLFMFPLITIFLLFILVWSIILFVFYCLPGTNEENNYGKKPV